VQAISYWLKPFTGIYAAFTEIKLYKHHTPITAEEISAKQRFIICDWDNFAY